MATIVNDRDVLLQAAAIRLETVSMPSNWQTQWSQVIGVGRPDDGADVTLSEVNGTLVVTGGGITLSAGGAIKGGKTTYGSGTGFFLGYSSSTYKFDIGNTTKYLRWDGTGLTYAGDITGAGLMTWTGLVSLDGAADPDGVGVTTGVTVNFLGNSFDGLRAYSTASGYAIHGIGVGNDSIGVFGSSPGSTSSGNVGDGSGVFGIAKGGAGAGCTGVTGYSAATLRPGVYAASISTSGLALQIRGTVSWGGVVWAQPPGTTTTFMCGNGSWADLTSLLKFISAGTTATTGSVTLGQAVGYLLVDTYGLAGQVKIPYYAV